MKTVSTTVINPKQVITIFNILRSIGLNTSHRGTKYLNKAIQIMIMSNNDVIIVEDIYKSVANIYGNITPKQFKILKKFLALNMTIITSQIKLLLRKLLVL